MAVTDLWIKRDGTRTDRYGKGKRYRVSVPGHPTEAHRTVSAARAREAVLLTTAPGRAPAETTVGELLDLWLPTKAALSRGGRAAVQAGYNHARGRWGGVMVDQVQRHEVEAWIASLQAVRRHAGGRTVERPASRDTKSKAASALRGALAIAVAQGLIEANAADHLKIPTQERRDPRPLSAAELDTLARESGDYAAMVRFLGATGVRVGECCGLDVGSLRKVAGGKWRARVTHTKGKRARDVGVPASVVAALDLERPSSAPLFVTSAGQRVDVTRFRVRVFTPAAKRAGLAGLHVHDLRHTAASLMIHSGANVKTVQQALGHRSAAMTLDLYSHLFEDGLEDVSDRMEALLGAAVAAR